MTEDRGHVLLQQIADAQNARDDAEMAFDEARRQHEYAHGHLLLSLAEANAEQSQAWYRAKMAIEAGTVGTPLFDATNRMAQAKRLHLRAVSQFWVAKHGWDEYERLGTR
jgi:hypothetical protein